MANKPSTDKQFKRSPSDFSIEFAPGEQQMGYKFNNLTDLRAFIKGFNDGDVGVTVNLNTVGSPFVLPVDEYDAQKIILIGRAMMDGTFPEIIIPEGATLKSSNTLIRLYQIKLTCQNTSTPVITPDGSYRINQDLATISSEGSAYFADMSNGGTFSISADRNSGLVNGGGSEIFYIPSGGNALVFLESDSYVDNDIFELEDATASLSVFFNPRGRFDDQSLVDPSSISALCQEHSGAEFPEITYPGKLFHLTTDGLLYCRNADNTAWVAQAQHSEILDSPGVVVNGLAGTFVQKINGVLNFISGDVYEITVSYIWGTNPDKTPFRSRLFINGVAQGITTVVPNTFIHYDEVVKATDVTELVPGAGTSFQKPYTHTFRYTAGATGALPVVLDFGTKLNTGYMARALIRSRRLPV